MVVEQYYCYKQQEILGQSQKSHPYYLIRLIIVTLILLCLVGSLCFFVVVNFDISAQTCQGEKGLFHLSIRYL